MTGPSQPASPIAAEFPPHPAAAPSTPASPASPSSHTQLLKCLSLLAPGAPDEQKFVALLLLPRLLDAETDPAGLTLCFDRMDWSFVHRLLVAQHDTPDMPQEALHSIAVNILGGFALNDELVQRPELLEQVPHLVPLLVNHSTGADVRLSILETLYRIATTTPEGPALVGAYAEAIGAVAIAHANDDEDAASLAFSLLSALFIHSQAATPPTGVQLVSIVAKIFADIETKLKFDAASLLVEMTIGLDAAADATLSSKALPAWALDVRIGVMNILRSKIGTDHRDLAFVLTASMLRIHSPAWLSLKEAFSGPASPLTPAQFTTLLTHLAGGEIRLLLDDATPTETADSSSSHTRGETRLVVCADIIEGVMRALMEISDDAETAGLREVSGGETIQGVRQSLHETFDAVMAYIVDVWAHYQHTPAQRLLTSITTHTALRLLATYLAEADCPAEQTVALMPVLVLALQWNQGLIPAIEALTADTLTREAFLARDGVKAVVNFWAAQQGASSSTPPEPMVIRSVASTLLNILTTTSSTELKSHAETFRTAVRLAIAAAASSPPMSLRAHLAAFVALVARDVLFANNTKNNGNDESTITDAIIALTGTFLRDGVDDGFRGVEWQAEAVRDLYLLTASAVAISGGGGKWAEQIRRRYFADLSEAKLGRLEPEMRQALLRISTGRS
ncbi:hypothetical protein HDU88_003517 [Geranomyces variabilis]|nr:hypothetical protein HDU88_003517 [Geranomyces variabilis]